MRGRMSSAGTTSRRRDSDSAGPRVSARKTRRRARRRSSSARSCGASAGTRGPAGTAHRDRQRRVLRRADWTRWRHLDPRPRAAAKARQVFEVVGVVKDMTKTLSRWAIPRRRFIFRCAPADYAQPSLGGMTLMVRAVPGVDAIAAVRARDQRHGRPPGAVQRAEHDGTDRGVHVPGAHGAVDLRIPAGCSG